MLFCYQRQGRHERQQHGFFRQGTTLGSTLCVDASLDGKAAGRLPT